MGKGRPNGAPVARGTVSRVNDRNVIAPASPNTVYGPRLDASVRKRAPVSPSIVSGPSVGKRGRNGAPVARDTVSRVGYGNVGPPGPLDTVSGRCWDTMVGKRASIPPHTVPDPAQDARLCRSAIVSSCTVSAVDDCSGGVLVRRPNIWQPADVVNCVRSLAGGYQPRVLSMGASDTVDGGRHERRAVGMAEGFRADHGQSDGLDPRGVADTRGLEATAVSGDPVPSQDSNTRQWARSARRLGPGRLRGMLTDRAKTCHGCRNHKGKVKPEAKTLCRGGENADGKVERCHYWVCRKCLGKWRDARSAEGNTGNALNDEFICCMHARGPCVFQR